MTQTEAHEARSISEIKEDLDRINGLWEAEHEALAAKIALGD